MRRTEPRARVAIVGMSYRLPGGPDSLWQALVEGRDLVTTVDPSRWAKDSHYHPRRTEPGTSYTFAAGSIGDISGFDASFFGISPREAAQMDPQQRILLELAWEALESAGVRPSTLRGTPCGVYIGLSSVDYGYRLAYDLAGIDSSSATGGTASIAANRISHFLDLRGPSMVIDTACSSSLVAFHQACQSIGCGETREAIVGGISLHLHPYGFIAFSKASMLSRTGASRVFDADGDGYVRSEGGGIFVLKDLDEAIKDGNPILAVVAGTAVNAAGRSPGLTVPSAEAQAELLEGVYRRAGIAPAEIDYLEAHGTGTIVGDPLEARALGMALGQSRPRGSPLPIGSVKSNLGHLEAASGAAGLVKALLCLKHRVIPPTIHFDNPNPHIAFDDWNLKPVREATPLHPSKRLVIGVNSFGFGGANAHVVLESGSTAPKGVEEVPGAVAIMVSGHDDGALRSAALAHAALLESPDAPPLRDIAFSSVHARDWHAHRAIAYDASGQDMAAALAAFGRGEKVRGISSGNALAAATGPAFIYSGNGSVWAGMGAKLMAEVPLFAETIEHVDALLVREGGVCVAAELRAGVPGPRLRMTEAAQPMLFALQVGLTEVLRDRGIMPTDVAGHSVGEVAAAWACGALTLPEAVQVVLHRSRLQERTRGTGAMAAVALNENDALATIESLGLREQLSIACLNSPHHVTVAGASSALSTLEQVLGQRRVFCRRLDLDYAFHGPAMDPIHEELLFSLRGLRPGPARIPFHSTVTGNSIPGTLLNADYWWNNVRGAVRFEAVIRGIVKTRANVLVEVGPQPILRNYINDCMRAESVQGRVLAAMERARDGSAALRECVHQVVVAGCAIDAAKVFPQAGQLASLPAYPWQRERHWRATTPAAYPLVDRAREHPLLGHRLHEAPFQWENQIDTVLFPYLRDHVVGGTVVFPASGFVEMALAASALIHGGETHEVESIDIRSPLVFDEAASKTIRFGYEAADGRFTIRSRARLSEDPWQLHVTGKLLGAPYFAPPPAKHALPARRPEMTGAEHYDLARSVGLAYGPSFQTVACVWTEGSDAASARLTLPDGARQEANAFRLHPASLDGGFQILVDLLRDEISAQAGAAFIPVQVGRIRLYLSGASASSCVARITARSPRSLVADFELYGASGERIADLVGVRLRGVMLKLPASSRLRRLVHRAVARPHDADRFRAPDAGLEALAEVFAARLHALGLGGPRERYYAEVEPLTDVLCAGFAERAVREISGGSAQVRPDALSAGVPRERALLLKRLVAILEEDQLLEPDEDGWLWSAVNETPEAQESWITLLRDYPDEAGLLIALGPAGMRLAQTLAAPLAADDDSSAPARQSYVALSSGPWFANAGRAIAETVRTWIARAPAERPLRVLEIAPARSEITHRVLAAVDRDRCEYFVGCTSEETLSDYEALAESGASLEAFLFATGDEDGNEAARAGPFDAVIVPDGLQTFADADAALARLSGLLADGGVLLMLGQHPSRWSDVLFGGDPAWWVRDAAGAWRSKLRSPAAWESQLLRSGFDSVIPVPELPGVDRGCFALFARAAHPAPAEAIESVGGEWVFVNDDDGYGAALATVLQSQLRDRGARTFPGAPGIDKDDAIDFRSSLAAARAAMERVTRIVCFTGFGREDGAPHEPQSMLQRLAGRCASLSRMLQACRELGLAPDVHIVMAGATHGLVANPVGDPGRRSQQSLDNSALWGFARALANEYPDLRIQRIDCADLENLEIIAARLMAELSSGSAEDEIILARGGRYALRLGAQPTLAGAPIESARLDFTVPGSLRNLAWRAHPRRATGLDEVEIEVKAAGLNFRDVMYTLGLLSDEAVESGFAGPTLGMELSGTVSAIGARVTHVKRGDEVVAFAPASLATHVTTTASAVAMKPASWSFEAAATVPTAYFTVLYALGHLAHLREGESILIHGAAGGVGIAAIQLARSMGAEVFATAGSADKREFVRLLGADHVFDSRTLAFADEILQATGGRGVDVVLNSLSGEAISRNLRVLRPFGRFLELGKRDFYENTAIGLRAFRNNISYFGIDADQLLKERPELARELFAELMTLAEEGVVSPLPFRAFAASEAIEAFRHMQQSRHIGKIVLTFADGVKAHSTSPARDLPLELRSDATYLITGGLGGFGLKTAQWLVARGAGHLLLLSRAGAESLEAKAAIADLEALGAKVNAVACDVTDRDALERLLDSVATRMPPLRGVVHAASVIDDGLAQNMSAAQIAAVLAPKVLGARHLDEITRGKPLDFFVLYSSATTLFGNPGQSSYVAANCFLEALARARRSAGLAATCIAWGAIGDVGYLARNRQVKDALVSHMGGAPMDSDAALAVLEQAIVTGDSGAGVLEFSWRDLRRFLPAAASPRFKELGARADDDLADGDRHEELKRLALALGAEELAALVGEILRKEVAEILRMPPERLDMHQPLRETGLDSLMGMELLTAVEMRFGVNLQVMALSEGPSIAALVERIVRHLKSGEDDDGDAATPMRAHIDHVAAKYAGELDRHKIEELTRSAGDAPGGAGNRA